MENSSRRSIAQRHIQTPSRRTILQLAVTAPVALLPSGSMATSADVSADIPAPIAGYYAFLQLELAAIETAYGLQKDVPVATCRGLSRGEAMQQGSTIEQRYEWMSHFTDTRALFRASEA